MRLFYVHWVTQSILQKWILAASLYLFYVVTRKFKSTYAARIIYGRCWLHTSGLVCPSTRWMYSCVSELALPLYFWKHPVLWNIRCPASTFLSLLQVVGFGVFWQELQIPRLEGQGMFQSLVVYGKSNPRLCTGKSAWVETSVRRQGAAVEPGGY